MHVYGCRSLQAPSYRTSGRTTILFRRCFSSESIRAPLVRVFEMNMSYSKDGIGCSLCRRECLQGLEYNASYRSSAAVGPFGQRIESINENPSLSLVASMIQTRADGIRDNWVNLNSPGTGVILSNKLVVLQRRNRLNNNSKFDCTKATTHQTTPNTILWIQWYFSP